MYYNEICFFFFKKNLIFLLVVFFTFNFDINAFSQENLFEKLNNKKQIQINFSGNNYIRYLKQIQLVGKKENLLNNSLINTSKKRWIRAKIKFGNEELPIKIKLHGNNSDHISIPYSSLNLKRTFDKFDKLNLLKPNTRNHKAEIFGTIFLKNLDIIVPETRYINVKINKHSPEQFLLQEKIDDKLLKRREIINGPIIKFSDKDEKIYETKKIIKENVKFFEIFENANDEFIKNMESSLITYKAIGLINYKSYFNNYYNFKFQALISILDGCHGLSGNDPIFYYNKISNEFFHIYYDGMFFNQNNQNYFCDDLRFVTDPKFKIKLVNELEKKFSTKNFKKKIKDDYNSKIIENDESFEYFWELLLKRYELFKKKDEFKNSLSKKRLSLQDKLDRINFFYPFVYSYSKNNKFYLCIKWPSHNEKSFIINEDKQILNKKNFNNCQKIRGNKVKKIINGNLEFYYPKEKIKIHTSIIGNLNDKNFIQ